MSLSNFEIQDIAKQSNIPLDFVLNKDEIIQTPYVIKFRANKNWNIIINLQNLYSDDGLQQPGSHWVALSRVSSSGSAGGAYDILVYWDSYGYIFPNEVMELAKKIGVKQILYNDKQVQRISTTICGYYALFFIYYLRYYLKKGLPPKMILERLNKEFREPIENTNIFKRLLKRYF